MSRLALALILEAALTHPKLGPRAVYRMAQDALRRAANRAGWKNTDHFLDYRRLDKRWRKAVNQPRPESGHPHPEPRIKPDLLADCALQLGMSLEDLFELVPPPWNTLLPDSEVVVALGYRAAAPVAGLPLIPRLSHSLYDLEVFLALQSLLNGTLRLNVQLPIEQVGDLHDGDIKQILERHPRAGLFMPLGTPNVNPLTDGLAEELLGRYEHLFKIKFLFRHTRNSAFLCQSCPKDQPEEGMLLSMTGKRSPVFLPRAHDSEVMRFVASLRGQQGAAEKLANHTFKDCGLLVLDFERQPPIILAAGHSGVGTRAAVEALNETSTIAAALDEPKPFGRNRAIFLVDIDRRKLSLRDTDDFDIAERRLLSVAKLLKGEEDLS